MRRGCRVVIAVAAALTAASCTCGPPRDGAVKVEVRVTGLSRGCIEVTAADAKAAAPQPVSTSVAFDAASADRTRSFAVFRKAEWSTTLALTARAHEVDCNGPVVATAGDPDVDVPAGTIVTRSFLLGVADTDGDGFAASDAGGTDCDDANAQVHPGAVELCGNDTDDDCDGLKDCFDSSCAGVACDDLNACTTNDVCGAGGCAGTALSCSSPPGVCFAAIGSCGGDAGCTYFPKAPNTPCDAGMVCNNGGSCVGADTEYDCTDGITNDSDALVDCADPDCLNVTCDAGLCITGETCQANGSCAGAPVVCAAPASDCFDAGVCNPGTGGCNYAPLALGAPCTDSNLCTTGDGCNGAGACLGTAMTCTIPGACEATGGAYCDAGTCLYGPATGVACTDPNACTYGDVCSALKVCAGTPYTCSSPPDCQRANGSSSCEGDGGCVYAADPGQNGQPCDGGTCAAGSCVGAGTFLPSNFDPATAVAAGNVVINCAVTFDSTDAGVNPSNWCGGGAPAVYGITQTASSEPAMVLSMLSLSITSGGTLKLIGSRPVILGVASTGTTTIDGVIDARANMGTPGSGGNRPGCGAQGGGDGGTYASSNWGTGGGGAGFLTRGGDGGYASGPTPGAAGGAIGPTDLLPLVGGCRGGTGGRGQSSGPEGGAGGGGVQLSAAGTLVLTGNARVSASGGGGRGGAGNQACGGAGGGSAGGVLLEAPTLRLASGTALTANGGSGGEASDLSNSGNNGNNGSLSTATPASGGSGNANFGGSGGPGGAGTTPPGGGVNDLVGGGGGGSAGRIVLRATAAGGCTVDAGTIFSPPAQFLGTCP